MDAALLKGWLHGLEALAIVDEASVALARSEARRAAQAAGLGNKAAEELAIVASELGHNQLRHARGGHLAVRLFRRGEHQGVELVAADLGRGIAEPTRALSGAGASEGADRPGLGIGLAGVRRLSDELDVDVRLGEGSCLWARKMPAGAPRGPELAVFGRKLEGETVAGDDAAFVRGEGELLMAVADGLGHGEEAHVASSRVVAAVRDNAERPLEGIVAACQHAAADTRGSVLGVARMDALTRRVAHVVIGDITATVFSPRAAKRFVTTSGVLGGTGFGRPARRPRVEDFSLDAGAVLIFHTDGVKSRLDLSEELALLRQHPVVIAEHVIAHYARPHDDALVMVVR